MGGIVLQQLEPVLGVAVELFHPVVLSAGYGELGIIIVRIAYFDCLRNGDDIAFRKVRAGEVEPRARREVIQSRLGGVVVLREDQMRRVERIAVGGDRRRTLFTGSSDGDACGSADRGALTEQACRLADVERKRCTVFVADLRVGAERPRADQFHIGVCAERSDSCISALGRFHPILAAVVRPALVVLEQELEAVGGVAIEIGESVVLRVRGGKGASDIKGYECVGREGIGHGTVGANVQTVDVVDGGRRGKNELRGLERDMHACCHVG